MNKKVSKQTEIIFFHNNKKVLDVEKYIGSQASHEKIPTIGELLSILCEATFHYEILTKLEVCEKPTLDGLARHYIDDFFGYSVGCIDVYRKYNKQYLSISIDFDRIGGDDCEPDFTVDYTFDDDDFDEKATTKNMKKYCNYDKILSKEGKMKIPEMFKEEINPEDPTGVNNYLDGVKVAFKFDHVDNCESSNIFDFVEIVKRTR